VSTILRVSGLVVALIAPAAWGQGDLPDLVLHVPTLQANAHEALKSIGSDDCTLQLSDRCVDGPGTRRLLRFSVLALNKGTADLFLGTPSSDDPRFVFSQCHDHFHFESFARYELRAPGGGAVVKSGQKRSFCIEDLRTDPDAPVSRPCTTDDDCQGRGRCASGVCQYNCQYQGIQPGRGDIYESNLDCQWIDTTDVPPGSYELWVLLNTEQLLPEARYDNNGGMIPVTVGPAADAAIPRVRVRTRKKVRVGRALKIAWKAKLAGGAKGIDVFDVWLSRDGGATFPELLATGVDAGVRKLGWPVSGAATDQAVIRVVAWAKNLQQGVGTSRPLRIQP
jgi:hypothetical protein